MHEVLNTELYGENTVASRKGKSLLIILALGEWMRGARAIDVRGKDVMMRRKEEMELPRRVRLLSALCFLEFLVRSET